ncbi:tetraspanin8 [Hibiscus trionum]|uniref:Tetraspanin8 n=1 Tax=Hibiscus trionum TaxID=183268 RepID=A0A9W7I6Y7_HIBTR|nr:tetraspanin8 [Hibiscus trionum]
MAFRLSNNLVGILNFITFLLSIPILGAGIWLSREGVTECEQFLDKPVIVIGAFLMIVSLAGMIGACCRVTWLLWLYLVVMFLLIVLGIVFTIFAFAVTNKGAGETLSGRGYKEYRLGDYSNWLQKRVTDGKNWNKIKSCLADSKVCTDFHDKYLNVSVSEFYQEHLSSVQSGCCKPSNDCQFDYVGPTNWTRGAAVSTNPDCNLWDNNLDTLCFNCQSCKAGFIDNLKSSWKKVAIVNIVFLVFLIVVYSIGCCAFRNNRRDNHYQQQQPWKP